MAKQVPWTKEILEEFIRIGSLTEDILSKVYIIFVIFYYLL